MTVDQDLAKAVDEVLDLYLPKGWELWGVDRDQPLITAVGEMTLSWEVRIRHVATGTICGADGPTFGTAISNARQTILALRES